MKMSARIEFGDFQTPLALAREVCLLLKAQGVRADVIIEPTCGLGTFLQAAAECHPEAELRGFDINSDYVQAATERLNGVRTRLRAVIRQQDFFAHDWDSELGRARGTILVLGNLPWVTNQTVASLNGSNVPAKENFQGFRGIAARTGKSNFDISEWMLIRLLNALRGRPASISMLNSGPSRALLEALIFDDAKRPITVELLQRLDFSAIAKEAGMASRWRAIQRVSYARQTEVPQMELVMEAPEQARPGRRWKQVQVRVMTSRGRGAGRDAPTIWRGLRH
jgi:hypothetical protein